MPMPSAMEMIEMPVYDTEDFARMGQRIHLFARPVGSMATSIWCHAWTKNFWETSLYNSAQLEAPNSFIVRDISVMLYDEHGPLPVFDRGGLGNLWAKSHLEFLVGCKMYWQGPISMLADPVCQLGGLQALQSFRDPELGSALRWLNYQREHPLDVEIRDQEMFQVMVTPYTPVCRKISVRVMLNGKKIRPVL